MPVVKHNILRVGLISILLLQNNEANAKVYFIYHQCAQTYVGDSQVTLH